MSIISLAFLWRSGSKPAIPPRYARVAGDGECHTGPAVWVGRKVAMQLERVQWDLATCSCRLLAPTMCLSPSAHMHPSPGTGWLPHLPTPGQFGPLGCWSLSSLWSRILSLPGPGEKSTAIFKWMTVACRSRDRCREACAMSLLLEPAAGPCTASSLLARRGPPASRGPSMQVSRQLSWRLDPLQGPFWLQAPLIFASP